MDHYKNKLQCKRNIRNSNKINNNNNNINNYSNILIKQIIQEKKN